MNKKYFVRTKASIRNIAAIILCTIAMGSIFSCGNAEQKQISEDLQKKKLAVLVFENLTGNTEFDEVGKMVSDWVAQGLMQIDDVTVLTPSSIRDLMAQTEGDAMNYLAKNSDVDFVFDGNYYLDGDQLFIKAKLVNTATGEVEYYLPDYSSDQTEPLQAVKELTERIMGYWLNKKQIEKRKTNPPKYHAFKTFLKGMKYYEIDNDKFQEHMEEVLAIDTNYFEPYLFLAFSYYYNNYFATRRAERADSMIQALYARKIPLTAYQESLIKAAEAEVNGDTDQAFHFYAKLFDKYPDDQHIRFNAGTFALFSNHIDKAIEIYGGADFSRMDFSVNVDKRNIVFLFDALHQKGDFKKILNLSNKYLNDFPHYFYLLIAHINLGNEKEAEEIFNEWELQDEASLRLPKAYYYNILGREYLKLNQPNRAKICLQKSMSYAANNSGKINHERLYSLFYLEEYQKGINELEKLVPLFEKNNQPAELGTTLDFLAYFHAGDGDFTKAKKYQEKRDEFKKQHFFYLTDAYISMKKGDKVEAVDNLKKAYRAGVIFEDISFGHSVDFLPLHGYPPFDDFVRPK